MNIENKVNYYNRKKFSNLNIKIKDEKIYIKYKKKNVKTFR
jgi:hypothetical protein